MTGFNVDEDELRSYADKLSGQKDTASQISGLVDTADVGDESWGVVGLFVKGDYTEMLADLKDMFASMEAGLQSGSDKFKAAADGYRQHEDAVKELLNGMNVELGK
ncbi:ESX-1 secretion-associated protein [Prauserella cavernicola]|uniref:ESX-1 secretion-associated protein n=1 Tax=Prauserella cavernicola TaxID=2800127 RepID=A0A934QQ71_9PSEU|nr:ESX-1 secretion-associated protein [Prauserella cavernicola]MBK1784053.1 ESX-1 secretion-associated protein [Prauserella cavernicola]